eukprot:7176556-Pyramimonas_sp.AAC.1
MRVGDSGGRGIRMTSTTATTMMAVAMVVAMVTMTTARQTTAPKTVRTTIFFHMSVVTMCE